LTVVALRSRFEQPGHLAVVTGETTKTETTVTPPRGRREMTVGQVRVGPWGAR
jgi:hypothetical protein